MSWRPGSGLVARVLEIRRGDGTYRARVWRGLVDDKAASRTLAEHEAIYEALVRHDAALAQAAALLHIDTTERWLREHVGRDGD